jgi:hypothetical protein
MTFPFDDHIRDMTTWQTPPQPLYRRRPPERRSQTLVSMLMIPMLVALTVAMMFLIPVALAG